MQTFHDHPLKELYELRALDLFRRESCRLECPRCGAAMAMYVYRPLNWKCFFICDACLQFCSNYCLAQLIDKLQSADINQPNNTAIAAALDRVVKAATEVPKPTRINYNKTSGAARYARQKRIAYTAKNDEKEPTPQ